MDNPSPSAATRTLHSASSAAAANDNLYASFVPSIDQALLGLLSAVADSSLDRVGASHASFGIDPGST